MKESQLVYDPFNKQLDKKEAIKKELIKKEYLNRTLTIRDDHLEKLRAKAYWDRSTQREVLEEALENYFKDKNIKQYPK